MTTLTAEERLSIEDADLNAIHKAELTAICYDSKGVLRPGYLAPLKAKNEAHRLEWMARKELREAAEKRELAIARREEAAAAKAEGREERSIVPLRVQKARAVQGASTAPVVPATPAKVSRTRRTTCEDCGAKLIPSGKRGKPPVKCPACKEAALAKAETRRSTPNICRDCNVSFPNTGKKGRQPTRCESCKEIESHLDATSGKAN